MSDEIEGVCGEEACAVPPAPEPKPKVEEPKKPKPVRKSAPKREARKMPKKNEKKSHAGKTPKNPVGLEIAVMKRVRQLQAKLQLKTGDRTTLSQAVAYALDQVKL